MGYTKKRWNFRIVKAIEKNKIYQEFIYSYFLPEVFDRLKRKNVS